MANYLSLPDPTIWCLPSESHCPQSILMCCCYSLFIKRYHWLFSCSYGSVTKKQEHLLAVEIDIVQVLQMRHKNVPLYEFNFMNQVHKWDKENEEICCGVIQLYETQQSLHNLLALFFLISSYFNFFLKKKKMARTVGLYSSVYLTYAWRKK